MIITCPNCRTQYRIDPSTLGEGGRKVRCSNCSHRWLVEPFTEAATPPVPEPEPAPPEPVPPAPPPEQARPRGTVTPLAAPAPARKTTPARGGRSLTGWVLLVLLVLLLVGAVLGRNEIIALAPAVAPVYERLGLPITVRLGLEFRDLASARAEPGSSAVRVTGTIHNVSGGEVRVPQLRVALLDGSREEIRSQLFDPPQATLPAEGTASFELTLPDPPPEARDFTITFADRL